MSAIVGRYLRLACELGRPNGLLDQRTNLPPALLRGFDHRIQLGVFLDNALIDDVTNWQTVSLEVRTITGGVIDTSSAGLLITQAISTGFSVPSSGAWTGKTAQHATLTLSNAQTSIAAGDYALALWLLTTGGQRIPLGSSTCKVIEAGAGTTDNPPSAGDNYYTAAESDARFLGINQAGVPASSTATGTAGAYAFDGNYFYLCVAANTWRRTALTDWS